MTKLTEVLISKEVNIRILGVDKEMTAFPVPHNRPLCHLSENPNSNYFNDLRYKIPVTFYNGSDL
jgi:hypothetical protein